MTEGQKKFDYYAIPACMSELTSPVLHKVLKLESIKPFIWGGKGVGSQGDGSAQFLCKSKEAQERVKRIVEKELKMPCMRLTIGTNRKVSKCVIPTASYGANLFPASKAVSTALFPIVDSDGLAKPAILILVEEAIKSGIEQVMIIVSPHDIASFEELFCKPLPMDQFSKLPPQMQKYAQKIVEFGRRVTFVVQKTAEGLGHAVYLARENIKEEPFLLMLGDHLYRSNVKDVSCVSQLLSKYRGHNLIGLKATEESKVSKYGTVTGTWVLEEKSEEKEKEKGKSRLHITEIVEKPTVEYARKHLGILGNNEYLTSFGLYILDGGRLMEILAEDVHTNRRWMGAIQLTTALESLRKEQSLEGFVVILCFLIFNLCLTPTYEQVTITSYIAPHSYDYICEDCLDN